MNVWLEARNHCIRLNAKSLFLLWSEHSGYQIQYITPTTLKDGTVEEFKHPDIKEVSIDEPFEFTFEEFTDLPKQMLNMNFAASHCDRHMVHKQLIRRIANLYDKDYY